MLGFARAPNPDAAVLFLTIYSGPLDCPGHIVMRCFAVEQGRSTPRPAEVAGVYQSVEEARRDVPPGAHRFGRQHGDDPRIVESWMM